MEVKTSAPWRFLPFQSRKANGSTVVVVVAVAVGVVVVLVVVLIVFLLLFRGNNLQKQLQHLQMLITFGDLLSLLILLRVFLQSFMNTYSFAQ